MKKGIVVVGAGGHAKVCIEILQAMGEAVDFCVGDETSSSHCLDIAVLKGNSNLNALRQEGFSRVFIAIGLNSLRNSLAKYALECGYQLINAISPHAVISPSVQLGNGIAIMAGAVINSETQIADLAILNTGSTVDHDCQIGKAAHIGPQSALAGNVIVGFQSFLGLGSKVIPGVNIGNNVVVGAGSVVISNIKDRVTAVGVPARILKKV